MPDSQRLSRRSMIAALYVPPIRKTAESHRAAGSARAAGGFDCVLLAFRQAGEVAVRHLDGDRAVPGNARRRHSLVLRAHRHARRQGAARAISQRRLAPARGSRRGPADRAAGGDPVALSHHEPGDRPAPSPTSSAGRATGMSCGRAGPFSRTISPGASPPASCRPARRLRESVVLRRLPRIWYILVYGASAILLLASADLAAGAADRRLVRRLCLAACATSCRRCATARARCRKCARC